MSALSSIEKIDEAIALLAKHDIRLEGFEVLRKEIDRLQESRDGAFNAGLEAAAKSVPTSWLDPLLTGPDKVGEYDSAIEPLLIAIAARIRAMIEK